ncbi:poly aspartic acid hydrolase [Mycena galopus ATCC 62051]|nr:poly aspartic acid hydrolase [Mycena galopus ATCC 62051]
MLTGMTPSFASALDPRFSFGMYIPSTSGKSVQASATETETSDGPLPLLVLIHGTRRQSQSLLASFAPFADAHHVALLAPLFPAGIVDPSDVHNYKGVLYTPKGSDAGTDSIRFDLVLLGMLAQAARVWHVDVARVWMHGFSGGAQFVHRFVYLHAGRVRGASVGAPGAVTHAGEEGQWPRGLGDVEAVFRIRVDWDAVRRVKMLIVVGERDTDGAGLRKDEKAGKNRVERARYLHSGLVAAGVEKAELVVVAGMGHDGGKCVPAVEEWLARAGPRTLPFNSDRF